MQNFRFNFTHPWLLLLLIPAIGLTLLPYLRASKKYRKTRNRILSMVFHGLAMVLAICLLSGISFSYEKPNLENELIILVDTSDSNEENADKKSDFVQSIINVSDGSYRIGVVKFGHGQVLSSELSYDTEEVLEDYLSSEDPNSTATDLAGAIKYAAGLIKNPETAKIVVLSDGIETDNSATAIIKAIAADGIRVDTAFFPNEKKDEIQIYSVKTPDKRIILGENFLTEVVVRSNLLGDHVGVLKVYDNNEPLGETIVTLNGREQTLEIALALEQRGMHELRFELEVEDDTLAENNSYRAFINLEAFDNILLIEHKEGEGKPLRELLSEKYKVVDLSIDEDISSIPRTVAELADFEQVILVNVAYSDMPAGFEAILNEYVYDLGGGLLTVGGENDVVNGTQIPHAYNRNDMASSTYYKQMLPINAIDYTPPIAVMIIVDASGSMSMEKLPAAKEGAEACLDSLNDRDFCGVMSLQSRSTEELQVLPVTQRERIRDAISKVGNGDAGQGGTIFSDAIMRAGNALSVIGGVERKHIIIVTDGKPGDPFETYQPYIAENVKNGITMSIVSVDVDPGDVSQMEKTAAEGGGSFYGIPYAELHTIPTIMQRDLALEAVAEIEYGEDFYLKIKDRTSVLTGIDEALIPPLSGYYGVVAKTDAKVPLMGEYVPIYAEWRYGEGNVGSFMCDLSGIWSSAFMSDVVGQTIINNIVNSIFPMEDVKADGINIAIKQDNYHFQLNVHGAEEGQTVAVEVTPMSPEFSSVIEEGVTVSALESNRRFNFLIEHPGLYEITVRVLNADTTEASRAVIYRTFSYSEEYNMFTEREPVGEELLALLAKDGGGDVIEDPAHAYIGFSNTLKVTKDPRIVMLILSILFVLLDIAVRKFKFKWIHELIRERREKLAGGDKGSV